MRLSVSPIFAALALAALAVPALAAPPRNNAPIVPSAAELAVYVPPSMLTSNTYLPRVNMWVEPGKALGDALDEVGRRYFPTLHVVPAAKDEHYGLLLDLAPKWSSEAGKLTLTVPFDVYGADGKKLYSGTSAQSTALKYGNFSASAQVVTRQAVQEVMAQVQTALKPDPTKFPATAATSKIDLAALVDRSKPLRTGTAFFVNKDGQLLTAAHVARNCVALEAHQDGATFPVKARAASDLLDVAVLDSGKPRATALGLRQGQAIELGESVTSVGYPLKGLLGDSPNVTRGNVSASRGPRGSMGMFQFSAPIQPGNSGGPIVSDNGELLGVAVSTLNAEAMAKLGLIPQNVNFALDGRYVAMFLQREKVPFETIRAQGVGSMQAANQAALSNTVQLNCYQ